MSQSNVSCDYSNRELKTIPHEILDMKFLKMLYLEGNQLMYLPPKFFPLLTNLTWLDLRNNLLLELPADIGDHTNLQTLLLQNNRLEYLPNELGLVKNLTVLQLSGNPLRYPAKNVIINGTKYICKYLKEQYCKIHGITEENIKEKDPKILERKSSAATSKQSDKKSVLEVKRRPVKSNTLSISTLPVISVKSLSKIDNGQICGGEIGTKHSVVRKCRKFIIKSQFSNSNKYVKRTLKVKDQSGINEQMLKDVWLNKLKEVLREQERLIQQEKNLQSLNDWRMEKRLEPKRLPSEEDIIIPPYATESEHNRILSRADLKKEFDKISKRKRVTNKKSQGSIDKLMDNVLSQLKKLQNQQEINDESPRTKMLISEKEIKAILELHKKIAQLQELNVTT